MRILIFLFLFLEATNIWAQEMCFSCNGTYFVKNVSQVKANHAFGLCLNKKDMSVTYDTEGSRQSKWTFFEKIDSVGTVYYYWQKEYDNSLFGRLSEQIELSDVKYQYQYFAKDKLNNVAVSVNGQCIPVLRIGN
nr:hypothetical protein [uncultured Limnohabitans sp.]